jgi:hypothetical protein
MLTTKKKNKMTLPGVLKIPSLLLLVLLVVAIVSAISLVVGRHRRRRRNKRRFVNGGCRNNALLQPLSVNFVNENVNENVNVDSVLIVYFTQRPCYNGHKYKHKQRHRRNSSCQPNSNQRAAIDPMQGTVVPYTLCNSPQETPLLTNIVIQSQPFPPIPNQPLTLHMTGTLSQPVTSATYHSSARVLGFVQVFSSQGMLPAQVLPLPAGDVALDVTFIVPQVALTTSPTLRFELRDSVTNQLITCLETTVPLANTA